MSHSSYTAAFAYSVELVWHCVL